VALFNHLADVEMEESEDDSRLVISSTSEFVRNLGTTETVDEPVEKVEIKPTPAEQESLQSPLPDETSPEDIQIDEIKDVEMAEEVEEPEQATEIV
jgi:hypothetical protein